MADFLPPSDADEETGWRHDPRVAYVAIGVAVLVLLMVFSCRVACRPRQARPPEMPETEGVVMVCRHDGTQYTVTARDVRGIPGRGLSVKALKVPCPTCGKADSPAPVVCRHCKGFFCPIDKEGEPNRTCPHCGKDPWK